MAPDPAVAPDVEAAIAAVRAAWGDDELARERERALNHDADTAPREGDPPQPTDQRPYRSRGPLGRAPVVTADVVLKRAASQLGYREEAGNRTKFGAWYGLDGEPWCAMFMSWSFFMSGLPLPASTAKGFAGCSNGADWFEARGRFTDRPAKGHLVFFDWDDKGGLDHIGIVERVLPDGSVQTIEGNTGDGSGDGSLDGVFRRARKAGIVGYGIPEYGTATKAPAVPPAGQRPAPPTRTKLPLLEQGATGPDVRRLQGLLRAAFPRLTDNDIALGGTFGDVTVDLVRRFQRERGLGVDGQVGEDTWRALLGLAPTAR